ncbi:transposase, partial [Vibrio cholerae]|uniref:transposase n=1 Tax=Vibrio cholerae TaxID=666 RepID=UPI003A101B3A
MTQRRKPRKYTDEFREEAVKLVTEQGYSVTEAAKSLGITTKRLFHGVVVVAGVKQRCCFGVWFGGVSYTVTLLS